VHHIGILYDQFMMHGQRNIKLHYYNTFFLLASSFIHSMNYHVGVQ